MPLAAGTRVGVYEITEPIGIGAAADGQSIYFSSAREGTPVIYRQRADGTGSAERLTQSAITQFPLSLSPDGTQFVP
jgi:Tol biopolymer transport system component